MTTQPRFPASGGAASPAELADAKEVLAARAEELTLVRAAATKWQAGLAALLAVVTGLSVSSLGAEIRELQSPWAVAAALTLLAAYVLGVASLLTALRASGGMPTLVRSTEIPGSAHAAAVQAAADLRRAIRITIASLVVFGLAVAMLWFAPQQAATEFSRVATADTTACGRVDVTGPILILTGEDKSVEVIPLEDVTSWERVDACP